MILVKKWLCGKMGVMNILYCGDKGISRGVLVSVLSLLKYNREPLQIYIMTIDYEETKAFEQKTAEFLDRLVSGRGLGSAGKRQERGEKKQASVKANANEQLPGSLKNNEQAGDGIDVDEELPEWLINGQNPESFVKLTDATEVFARNLPAKNMGSYFTPCSMLRLYADKVPELARLERLLYLFQSIQV